MNIKTKFSIGGRIISIAMEEAVGDGTECKTCDGKGKIKLVGKKGRFKCPTCFGKGLTPGKRYTQWVVRDEGKIDGITVNVWKAKSIEKISISYDGDWGSFDEDELYGSEVEAQAECDRRNKKRKKKR